MAAPRRCCKCNRTAKCVRCACVQSSKPCLCCLPGDLGRCQNRGQNRGPNNSRMTSPPFPSAAPIASQSWSPPEPCPSEMSVSDTASSSFQASTLPCQSTSTSALTGRHFSGPRTSSAQAYASTRLNAPNSSILQLPTEPSLSSDPDAVDPFNTAVAPSSSPGPAPSPSDALPALDSILRLRIPTLQHVPKAARDSWALLLSDALSAVVADPSLVGPWCKFFMLSKCVLANPPRGGRSHWRDTLK